MRTLLSLRPPPCLSSTFAPPPSSFLFSFRPHRRFHFLTPCSSLKQTKKQKTLPKTTTPNAPPLPPQSFKWPFSNSNSDENNGAGDGGLEGDTAVKGTLLAGFLLVGVVGGFGAVGYVYKDQINAFLNQLSTVIEGYGPAGYALFVAVYAGLEAVRLLGAPARFEASKLKVVLKREEVNNKYVGVIPRTYILSHCDFTANLTLTISHVINLEQLRGWYSEDDVVAEWKKVNGEMCLHVHCFVSGPNLLLELAVELRYQIFSKELPLVLKAVFHGDSALFAEHPKLQDSLVRVHFHSSLQKYNKMECWGPLRDAIEGRQEDRIQRLLTTNKSGNSVPSNKWRSSKSIFQALFAFLL